MSNDADPADERPQKRARLDETFKEDDLISFQLVHFRTPKAGNSTSLRFADDSDYGDSENEAEEPQAKKKRGRPPKNPKKVTSHGPRMFPVMEETFYMRYFRCHKTMKLEILAKMLASKMSTGDDFTVHFMNVRAFHLENRELPHDMTLGQLATELSWKRRRPMRLVFTLLPTKQLLMSPSTEGEPMPQLELQDNENVEQVVFEKEPSPPPPMLCSTIPTTTMHQQRIPPNLVPIQTLTRPVGPLPQLPQLPKRPGGPIFLQQLPPGIPQQMRVIPPPQGFPHQAIHLPPGCVPDQLRMCQILQQQPQYIFPQQVQQHQPQHLFQQQQQQKILLQQAAVAQQRQMVAQHQIMEQNKRPGGGGYAAQMRRIERENAARAQAQAIADQNKMKAQHHLQQIHQQQNQQLVMQMRRNQEIQQMQKIAAEQKKQSGEGAMAPPPRPPPPSHLIQKLSSSASTPTSSTASPIHDLHKSSSTPTTPAHSQPGCSKMPILTMKLSHLEKMEKHINPNLRPYSAKVQVRALPVVGSPVAMPCGAAPPRRESPSQPDEKPFAASRPKVEVKSPSSTPDVKPKLEPLPVPPLPPLPRMTAPLPASTASEAGIDAGTLAKMKGQRLGKTLVANAFVRKPAAPPVPTSSASTIAPQDSPSSSAPSSTDTSANTSPASSAPSPNAAMLQGFSAETVNGEIQISASAERLNMLRNSTIVHSM